MSFTLWRGVVGMVRPTRRPGNLEELIRLLPEGIGIVPLMLNFKAGSNAEFAESIPLYEQFAGELAEQGVDMIMLLGAPPFMLLGPKAETKLTNQWQKRFKTPVVTDPQMHVAGLRAMKIKKFIGASYSALQNKIVLNYMRQAGFRRRSTRTSSGSIASIPMRMASTFRVVGGRRCAWSSCWRRISECQSCTPPFVKRGRSTSVSPCAKRSRATAGCWPNCRSPVEVSSWCQPLKHCGLRWLLPQRRGAPVRRARKQPRISSPANSSRY
jgi:hypothetical protein